MTQMLTLRNARLLGKLAVMASVLATTACITVNVNFPESAVQHAADNFVQDLYADNGASADNNAAAADAESDSVKKAVDRKAKDKSKHHHHKKVVPVSAPATDKPASSPTTEQWTDRALDLASAAFDALVPSAYAQEIDTNTPKANVIKARMRARIPEIHKWKLKGVICETSDGLLRLQNPAKAGAQAMQVQKLVVAMNADREALYKEIDRVNHLSDPNQSRIRKFFAAAFKKHSPPSGICGD